MSAFQSFRKTYGFLLLLAAIGSFLLVPLDLVASNYGEAIGRTVMGIIFLLLLPPKPRRI